MLTTLASGYTAVSALRAYFQYDALDKNGKYDDIELREETEKEITGVVLDYIEKSVHIPPMFSFGFLGMLGISFPLADNATRTKRKVIVQKFHINDRIHHDVECLNYANKIEYMNTPEELTKTLALQDIPINKYAFPLPVRVKHYSLKPTVYTLTDKHFSTVLVGTQKHPILKEHIIRSRMPFTFTALTVACIGCGYHLLEYLK
jgi:hypothetical protein